jgi:hypothetical protein
MPEASRVGASGDERRHLAFRRDQLVQAHVLLDAGVEPGGLELRPDRPSVHTDSLAVRYHGSGAKTAPIRAQLLVTLAAGRRLGAPYYRTLRPTSSSRR